MTSNFNLNQLLAAQKVKEVPEDLHHRYALRRALLNAPAANVQTVGFRQIFYWLAGGIAGVSLAVGLPIMFLDFSGGEATTAIEPILVEASTAINVSTVSQENKNFLSEFNKKIISHQFKSSWSMPRKNLWKKLKNFCQLS